MTGSSAGRHSSKADGTSGNFTPVVLVTGAASGLGRRLALDLAGRARLGLGDRNRQGLDETLSLVENAGGEGVVYPLDVTDSEQCSSFTRRMLQAYGRLDALFLCAGLSMWARVDEVRDVSVFSRLVEVNYLGAVYCILAALPALKASRGSIVAVSSLQGVLGLPLHSGYAGAKHALNGFLESLWFEVGSDVRIMTVMPGWIRGTSLRASALTATGGPAERPREHSGESVSVEECSRRILAAWRKGKRELYIPAKLALLPWLFRLSPRLVKHLLERAVADQR